MGRHRRFDSEPPSRFSGEAGSHPPHRGRRGRSAVRTVVLGAAAVLTAGGMAVGVGVTSQNPFFGGGSDDATTSAASEDISVPDYYSPTATADADRSTPSASRSARSTSPTPTASRSSEHASPSPTASRESADASVPASRTPTAAAPPHSASAPARSSAPATPTSSAPATPTSSAPATPTSEPAERTPTAAPSERPTSTSPTASPTQSADTQSAEESEVLSLVNQERADAGCSPVEADPTLGDLAGDFSQDMAVRGFFDHTDPDGDDPWDRAGQRGIDNLGAENIAKGQTSAQAVMDSWMQSSGHRANILNCDFRTLGVGAYIADGGHWWTQEFGY